MKFGIFYVLECPDHDFTRAYREMLEQISYAEKLGFDEVWLAEHHGSDYGSMPSPQVAAAAIAERTERMRIGIAVSNLTFDWPVRIAEDYAMVDVLSGGRLDFGVGRGYQPQEFRNMGVGNIQGESREVFVEASRSYEGCGASPWANRSPFTAGTSTSTRSTATHPGTASDPADLHRLDQSRDPRSGRRPGLQHVGHSHIDDDARTELLRRRREATIARSRSRHPRPRFPDELADPPRRQRGNRRRERA